MFIKNRGGLSTSKLKSNSLCILEAGIDSVLPQNVMSSISWESKSRTLIVDKKKFKVAGRVFVVGAGKASAFMAEVIEEKIGKDICGGLVLSNNDIHHKCKRINLLKSTHPYISRRNLRNTRDLLDIKDVFNINSDDLVICLISGGGSAMLENSLLSYRNIKRLNKHLILSGAKIEEINLIRKLVSNVKAGGLALHFSPAKVVGLIISDVVSGKIEDVSSGPTFLEDASFVKAGIKVAKKYGVDLPFNFEEVYGEIDVYNYLLADNRVALKAMEKKAKSLGFSPVILTNSLSGEPHHAAVNLLHEIFTKSKHNSKNCFLFGGEVSPKVTSKGKGGRNQHLVLLMHKLLDDYSLPWCVASMGSDGCDFMKGVSGAVIDHQVSLDSKIDKYIDSFNSYKYFRKVGNSLIKTKLTGTNVSDLGVVLK